MNQNHNTGPGHGGHSMHAHPYRRLLLMAALSFVCMYLLMYAMVNTIGNVYPNLNQFYMAGLMTAPMVIIEHSLMSSMYQNKRLNTWMIATSVIAGLVLFALIRKQAAIADDQFLRSMIPHHAGAILMCEHASIQRFKNFVERLFPASRQRSI